MSRVVGIDHISIRVSDYEKSKAFYSQLFTFLGFEVSDEYPDTIGWTNGKTRYWIAAADPQGNVEPERAGGDGVHVHRFIVLAEPHDRALAEIALDLGERGIKSFRLVHGRTFNDS